MTSFTKNWRDSDITKNNNNGHIHIFPVPEGMIAVAKFEPGWKWSVDMKKEAGTEWCEMDHRGYCIGGCLEICFKDGRKMHVEKGDVFHIEAGHDAENSCCTDCYMLDFCKVSAEENVEENVEEDVEEDVEEREPKYVNKSYPGINLNGDPDMMEA